MMLTDDIHATTVHTLATKMYRSFITTEEARVAVAPRMTIPFLHDYFYQSTTLPIRRLTS